MIKDETRSTMHRGLCYLYIDSNNSTSTLCRILNQLQPFKIHEILIISLNFLKSELNISRGLSHIPQSTSFRTHKTPMHRKYKTQTIIIIIIIKDNQSIFLQDNTITTSKLDIDLK